MGMNDFCFPTWFLRDSCARGRGKGFRETLHDLRQLRSLVHGWELLAPARWCWQEVGTRQACVSTACGRSSESGH